MAKYDLSQLYTHKNSIRLWEGRFRKALSEALNETGNAISASTKDTISKQTGLTIASASSFVISIPSTSANLVYEMRVQAGMIEIELNNRPLPQRGFPAREVRDMPKTDETKLVNLVTSDDNKVCPICQEISKEGPYSMEEFNRLRAVHPHLLSKALGCRCALVSFKPTKPTTGIAGADQAHIDFHTAQADLAASIKRKVQEMIRAR